MKAVDPSGLLLFLLQRKEQCILGNKSNTEIKILTFYDGDAEAVDAFADVIRYKMRQRIRDGKKLKITNETDGNVCEGAYNMTCEEMRSNSHKSTNGFPKEIRESIEYPESAPRLCG